MRLLACTMLLAALCAGAAAQTYCGQPDDGLIHIAPNYMTLLPPPKGGSYADPMYGCTITRLSNGPVQWNSAAHHDYSSVTPVSVNDSYILLRRGCCGYYVSDLKGNVVADMRLSNSAEPRWSVTDSNTFYYHTSNQLRAYNVLSRTSVLVKQFSQFTTINFAGKSDSKGDISDDGDHMMISDGGSNVFLYTISTDTMSPIFNAGGTGYDYWDVTPNNNVIVRWLTSGTARYQGIELYDSNMNFLRQVTPYGSHGDVGRDTNGDEVYVLDSSPDKQTACGNSAGVEKIRLSDSTRTCLLKFGWWNEVLHIGVSSRAGIAILSMTDNNNPGTAYSFTLPANWQSLWYKYANEIIMLRLDHTLVQRLAHHRSIIAYYWAQPRAAVSRDGRYIVYDSNFGQNITTVVDYTDAYLINLF